MDSERKIIISTFKEFNRNGLTTLKDFNIDDQSEFFDKDYQKSIEARKEGNKLFTQTKHDEKVHEKVWKFYCKSIAFAANESQELALGYANRSALLLHLKKYKDSLFDINRALKLTESNALKVKLFCRQIKCFVALQEGQQRNSLEKAKFWLSKVDDENEVEKLNVMINRAEKLLKDSIPVNLTKKKENHISCDNDTVRINYNEKYGRGLVATQDICPGEFICVEKFYATSVNMSKLYAYCSHCLAISWALIPCDECAYYMFCSEKCKDEAWEKYHDIECHAKLVKSTHLSQHACQLSIRSLIMGIKEAGSIEKLKDLVNEVDKCKKPITKGFSNGQFSSDSFKSLYSLTYSQRSMRLDYSILIATAILLSLAQNTTIFGKEFQFKKLVKNEDIIFIGSLLLRLVRIFFLNSFYVLDTNRKCASSEDVHDCLMNACCLRGANISLFTNLINHSCNNNVGKFYTNDGRVVYYALKPIKKNSEIFTSYHYNFIKYNKETRQAILNALYEFKCSCLACKLNWPTIMDIKKQDKLYPDNDLSMRLMVANEKLVKCINDANRTRHSRKTIRTFAKDVDLLLQIVKEPTFTTQMFHEILSFLIENRYCEILKVPNTC